MDKHGKEFINSTVMNRVTNTMMTYAQQEYNYANIRIPLDEIGAFENTTQKHQFEESLAKLLGNYMDVELSVACGATSKYLYIGVFWDDKNE